MRLTQTISALCFGFMSCTIKNFWHWINGLMGSTDHQRQGNEFGIFQFLQSYAHLLKYVCLFRLFLIALVHYKYIQCNFYTFYMCPTFHCILTVLFTFFTVTSTLNCTWQILVRCTLVTCVPFQFHYNFTE